MKCCDMNSGMLRTPVIFERKAMVSNGTGGFAETWATIPGFPTQGFVKSLSGSERFASDRVEASTRVRATVRYVPGLTEADRVVIGGRAHNIRFIDDVEMRGIWLKIDLDGGVAT